jgi:hypothetical protein
MEALAVTIAHRRITVNYKVIALESNCLVNYNPCTCCIFALLAIESMSTALFQAAAGANLYTILWVID